jgi:hypothetical protein
MGVSLIFAQGCPLSAILLIFALRVAGVTGVHHLAWPLVFVLINMIIIFVVAF